MKMKKLETLSSMSPSTIIFFISLDFFSQASGQFYLIGGDYVDSGSFNSGVFVSQSGILCDYLGKQLIIFK